MSLFLSKKSGKGNRWGCRLKYTNQTVRSRKKKKRKIGVQNLDIIRTYKNEVQSMIHLPKPKYTSKLFPEVAFCLNSIENDKSTN